jgi:hypothetical protein
VSTPLPAHDNLTVTTNGLLLLALSDMTHVNGNEPSAATGLGRNVVSNEPPIIATSAIVFFDIRLQPSVTALCRAVTANARGLSGKRLWPDLATHGHLCGPIWIGPRYQRNTDAPRVASSPDVLPFGCNCDDQLLGVGTSGAESAFVSTGDGLSFERN